MNWIKYIINFYIYSSIHIGLGCCLLYIFSVERQGMTVDYLYLTFLFSSTVFTYSIHRIIGMSKVRDFQDKGRFAVITKFRSHIALYALLGFIGCGYIFLSFDWQLILLLVGAGFISMLYTLPVFGNKRRLRDFAYIKIVLIALVWSYVTETIPLILAEADSVLIVGLFIERCLFFLAITIPFDIRDLLIDQVNNVSTIPSKFGKNKSLQLSFTMLTIASMIDLCLWALQLVSGDSTVIILITYCISIILIYFSRDQEDDYYFSGLLDGSMMLPWTLYLLYSAVC